MKILIMVKKFYMGGFTKSLINFLLCAEKYEGLDIDVLCLEKNDFELRDRIPLRFGIVELGGLQIREDHIRKGFNWKYIFNKKRLFSVEYVIREFYHKRIRKEELSKTMVMKYSQRTIEDQVKRITNDFSFAQSYDCVVSWEEGLCNYLLAKKINAKHKIGYIHPNYLEVGFNKKIDKRYIEKLDRVVTISESCYETLCNVFPEYRKKIVYAPNRLSINYLLSEANQYKAEIKNSGISLLTVARINNHDKAVFRIVNLVKRLISDGYDFTWYIIGNGPDYESLKRMIEENNLKEYIVLLGEMLNPCPYMKSVDLMIMQSYREGRPVAVDESLVLGTPVVITNYSSAYEQVNDGITGYVVGNTEDEIYEGIRKIMNNKFLLYEFRKNVAEIDQRANFEDCAALLNIFKEVTKEAIKL